MEVAAGSFQPLRVGKTTNPRFRLVFLPGFGWHSDPYAEGVAAMVGRDGEGLLYDLPGHDSDGPPLTSHSVGELTTSIADQVANTARAEVPIAVAGESLGCAYVPLLLDALRDADRQAAGVILFAPPVLLNVLTLTRWSARALITNPRQLVRNCVSVERPLLELVRDEEKAGQLVSDPRFRGTVSWGYLMRSVVDVSGLAFRIRRIESPTLILQGEFDPLITRASLRLAERLCGAQLKKAVLVRGAGHSLFWDPRTDEVMDRAREWLVHVVNVQQR